MSHSRCAEAQTCFPSPHHPHRALGEAVLSPAHGNRTQILPRSRAQPAGHGGTGGTGFQELTGSPWRAGEGDQEQRGRQGCASEQCKHSPAHAGAGKDLEMMMGFVEISFNPALCVCVELFPPSFEGWSSLRGQEQGRERAAKAAQDGLWLPPLKAALCAGLPCCL